MHYPTSFSPVSFQSLSFQISKDMDLFIESWRNWFLGFFLWLCCFLFSVPNLLFFCYFVSIHHLFLIFSSSFIFIFPFYLLLFAFSTLVFPALASTNFHISLDISSSLLLLFSNQSQDCGKLTIVFPRLHSTSIPQ